MRHPKTLHPCSLPHAHNHTKRKASPMYNKLSLTLSLSTSSDMVWAEGDRIEYRPHSTQPFASYIRLGSAFYHHDETSKTLNDRVTDEMIEHARALGNVHRTIRVEHFSEQYL